MGMQALLTVDAVVNGEPWLIGAMGGFYLVPRLRGTGIGAAFHADVLRQCYPANVAGVLAFCEPNLVAYYQRTGGVLVTFPLEVRDDADVMQPNPQAAVWWPKNVTDLQSLDLLRSYRW